MKHLQWVVFVILFYRQESAALDLNNSNSTNDNSEPRIDYDQWKPLGRGDPLKQDPTYDYVPPVLDRVRYWIDPVTNADNASNKTNKKNEVLLLGVISKKTTTPPPPPTTTITHIAESRNDLSNNYLKYLDNNKLVNYHPRLPQIENRLSLANFHIPLFTKPKSSTNEQRVPYTVLMPPPIVTTLPDSTVITTKSPTEFTIEPSKLIYQSSSTGLKSLTTPTQIKGNFNEKIALHNNPQLPDNYMKLQFNHDDDDHNNRLLLEANSDHNVNYVTPPTLQKPEIMHKGHVSNENLENYVKIGRIEAQMQHENHTKLTDNDDDSGMKVLITTQPVTLQTIKMKNLENPLIKVLRKENLETTTPSPPPTTTTTTTTVSDESVLTTDPLFKHYKQPSEPVRGPLYLIIQGHSKVKTYGPGKQYYGIKIQEHTDKNDGEFDDLIKNKIDYHHHHRNGRSNNDLQTLKHVIQTKLGAIDFNKLQQQSEYQETELHYGYSIDGKDVSSENYYKGYVADGRTIQNS